MEQDKSGLFLVGIVAIVAIVGLIIMFTGKSSVPVKYSEGLQISSDDDVNLGGEAARKKQYSPSKTGLFTSTGAGFFLKGNNNPSMGPINIQNKWNVIVEDIDGDGRKEIFIAEDNLTRSCSNGFTIYGFDSDGNTLYGWPKTGEFGGCYVPKMSVLKNLISDTRAGAKLVVSYVDQNERPRLWLLNADGTGFIPDSLLGDIWVMNAVTPVIGDVTGDGFEEIIVNYFNPAEYWSELKVLNYKGQELWSARLPYNQEPPAIGDVDGDGRNEIIVETGMFWDDVILYGFEGDGSQMKGWPVTVARQPDMWTQFAGPTLGDFNGDNVPDILEKLSLYKDGWTYHVLKMIDGDGHEVLPEIHYPFRYGEGSINFVNLQKGNKFISRFGSFLTVVDLKKGTNLYTRTTGVSNNFVTYRDHLGNIMYISLESGNVKLYDAQLSLRQELSVEGEAVYAADIQNDGGLDIISVLDDPTGNVLRIRPNILRYYVKGGDWPYRYHDITNSRNLERRT